MKIRSLVLMLLPLLVGTLVADVPAPPPQGQRLHMRIVKDSTGAGGAVLQIPARLVTKQAALFDLAPLPTGSSSLNLVIAGMLLSAAIYFLGRWFFKRRKKAEEEKSTHANLAVALLALLGALALVHTAQADVSENLNMAVADGQTLEGTVAVQVRNDINEIVLHLTPPRRT